MKTIYILALVALVVFAGYFFLKNDAHAPTDTDLSLTPEGGDGSELVDNQFGNPVTYICAEDKTFTVGYGDKAARVEIEAGTYTLEQISVDDENGTKFANDGDQVQFWVRDMSAFILENGEETYTACRES